MAEIEAHDPAWFFDTSRQREILVQRDTHTIFLRGVVRREDLNNRENHLSAPTEASRHFPQIMSFLETQAAKFSGTLSRAMVVRLKPGGSVAQHIDEGSYYLIRDRFHLVLKSRKGSIMRSGNEEVRMREGELWWFDNKQHHTAINDSDDWRIHVIFDILPSKYDALSFVPVSANAL